MPPQPTKLSSQEFKDIFQDIEKLREESIRLETEKRRAEHINKQLAQIPPRFRDFELKDYKVESPFQHQVKRIVERFIETFAYRLAEGSGLIFHGKPGTGKTMLALLALKGVVRKGYTASYESSLLFLRKLREKEFESVSAIHSYLEAYLRKDLLILDEATEGSGKCASLADWEKKLLFELLNARYEKKNLSTVIVTNRTKPEMLQRLGEPILDRLSEQGVFLAFNWNSFRKHIGD